jgi:membrane associated rhomboid family serine protease
VSTQSVADSYAKIVPFSLPPVTQALIVINVLVFVAESLFGDVLIGYFALWPFGATSLTGAMAGFQPWQLLTYSFLHAGFWHIFLNMLALYMFGGQLERLWGSRRFLNLYLASVIAAAITQLIFSSVGDVAPYPTIGASGGVFGLLLAYAMIFPNRIIVLLFPPIPLPAWLFVTLYGMLELYLGVTGTQEGVAHFAHLGGMLGAWLLIRYWRGRPPFRRR